MIILPLLLLAASGLYLPDDPCEQLLTETRSRHIEYVHSGADGDQFLAVLQAVQECYDPETSHWHWAAVAEAEVLMREGLLRESREKLDAYLSRDSETFIARYVRALTLSGRLHLREGQPFEYLRSLLDAAQFLDQLNTSQKYQVYTDLAYAYSSIGALEQADRIYAEALNVYDDSVPRLTYLDVVLRRAVDRGERLSLDFQQDSLLIHANIREAVNAVDEMEEFVESIEGAAGQHDVYHLSSAYGSLYDLYRRVSDHELSLEYARRSLNMVPRSLSWQRGFAHRRVGSALLALEEYEEALVHFERALPFFEEHQSGITEAYLGIAHAYRGLGQPEMAEEVLRTGISLTAENTNLSSWGVLVFDRTAVLPRVLVSALLDQGRYEEAYLTLEETFGQRIRDAQEVMHYQRESDEFRESYARQQEELRDARREAFLEPDNPAVLARLREAEWEVARLIPGVSGQISISLSEIQSRLQHDNRVLLTYFLDDPAYAFVVRADTFAAIPLPMDHEAVWTEIRRIGFVGRTDAAPMYIEAEPLQKLYEYVFAPVEHLVPEDVPVTVIKDGALSEVPLPMLVAGEAPRFQYHQWPFLVHRNPFSLEVSGSMIGERLAENTNSNVVMMGRSTFGEDDVSLLGGDIPPPLPYVRNELESVYRHVGASTLLFDEQATRQQFLRNISSAGIVHVASHVQVSPDPSFTSILMAPDSPESSGIVYLQDLLGMEIPAQLVVLSACDSMQGTYRRGEGLMGLHYAFRSAGTDATLATLWPVDDEVMAELMDVFYAELAAGTPKDVALQRAQQQLIASHERLEASPFLWAGLVLSGDPSPVVIERSQPDYIWIWTFIAGLLVGAAIWYYRRRFPDR